MGRRTKLNDDVIRKMVQAIESGATYRLACLYAGISFDSFNRWRQAVEDGVGTPKQREMVERIQDAEGIGAVGTLALIQKAAKAGEWKAGAWLLERRFPDEYGRAVVENRHTNKDGSGPVEIELSGRMVSVPMGPEDLAKLPDDLLESFDKALTILKEGVEDGRTEHET